MRRPTQTSVRIPDVSFSSVEPFVEIAIDGKIHSMTLYEAQHLAKQIKKALAEQPHLPDAKRS